MPLSAPLSLHDVTTSGNVIFVDPLELDRFGFPIPIRGVHPFLIVGESAARDGTTHAHVVALTSKGSRTPGPAIPTDLRTGTPSFLSQPCFVYARSYHWQLPAWVLLEASIRCTHNLNRVLPLGVTHALRLIA